MRKMFEYREEVKMNYSCINKKKHLIMVLVFMLFPRFTPSRLIFPFSSCVSSLTTVIKSAATRRLVL